MTCVAAFKKDDHFVFVSDSRISTDDYKDQITTEFLSKNNHYLEDYHCLIAQTGVASHSQIVCAIPNLFNSFSEKYPEFNIDYVRFVYLKMVKDKFLELKVLKNEDAPEVAATTMIAKDDKAFMVEGDSSITEIEDFNVFGSGSHAFLGSYLNSDTNLDQFIRVLKGLKAACKYNSACGFPLIVLSNKAHLRYILNEEEVDEIIDGKKRLDI